MLWTTLQITQRHPQTRRQPILKKNSGHHAATFSDITHISFPPLPPVLSQTNLALIWVFLNFPKLSCFALLCLWHVILAPNYPGGCQCLVLPSQNYPSNGWHENYPSNGCSASEGEGSSCTALLCCQPFLPSHYPRSFLLMAFWLRSLDRDHTHPTTAGAQGATPSIFLFLKTSTQSPQTCPPYVPILYPHK